MGSLGGPGSEGSEGSACLWQAGSKGVVAARAANIKRAPLAAALPSAAFKLPSEPGRKAKLIPARTLAAQGVSPMAA